MMVIRVRRESRLRDEVGDAVVVDCALSEDAAEEGEGQGALWIEKESTVNIILACFLAKNK